MAGLQEIVHDLTNLTSVEAAELTRMLERRLNGDDQKDVLRKVTITLDETFTESVCNYAVGFLRIKVENNAETAAPAGSGTFARLGRIYGILTAGHVIKQFESNEVVGLVRFPILQPSLQNRRLNLTNTERIVIWNGNDGDAPDIAFLKLPEIDGRDLEAVGAVFYNLEHEREFKKSKAEHSMSRCHAVVGVVGEWIEEATAQAGNGKKIIVGGLFGAASNLRKYNEGDAEVVDVAIDHAAGPKVPKSYGGMSGGALWELLVELDQTQKCVEVHKRLEGVAFRQSDDKTHIISNGAATIQTITKQIAEKWPEAR